VSNQARKIKMNKPKSPSPNCVVRERADLYLRRTGLIPDSLLEDCKVIEPMRRLLALGLSAEEIEDLDIRQPMLQSICEYARLDDSDRDTYAKALDAVNATVKVIVDQIGDLDLESEMLALRKKALKRRMRVLQRLARALGKKNDGMPMAA
jgi:hypothetical protein